MKILLFVKAQRTAIKVKSVKEVMALEYTQWP